LTLTNNKSEEQYEIPLIKLQKARYFKINFIDNNPNYKNSEICIPTEFEIKDIVKTVKYLNIKNFSTFNPLKFFDDFDDFDDYYRLLQIAYEWIIPKDIFLIYLNYNIESVPFDFDIIDNILLSIKGSDTVCWRRPGEHHQYICPNDIEYFDEEYSDSHSEDEYIIQI